MLETDKVTNKTLLRTGLLAGTILCAAICIIALACAVKRGPYFDSGYINWMLLFSAAALVLTMVGALAAKVYWNQPLPVTRSQLIVGWLLLAVGAAQIVRLLLS